MWMKSGKGWDCDAKIQAGKNMTFALCLNNEGYEVSLELRKLYPMLPPEANDPAGYIRVIDESGEDYLYRADAFESIEPPLNCNKGLQPH